MCRGRLILAGSVRLYPLLFGFGDFGRGRLLYPGVDNSVGEIRQGLAHFKERRLPLVFQR